MRILQIHKIVSNKAPSYLKDKLPHHRRPLYSQNNNYNTFHEIRCRSSRYMSSSFPDAITAWNNVITHFDNMPSINILFEDTNHFLFLCPIFAPHRATLASSVIQILQKYSLNHLGNQSHLYLYGHPSINLADNRKIILSTIKYIKESRRYST